MSNILLQYPKKTKKLDRIGALKGGTLWDFSFGTFLSQNISKIEGEPFEVIKIFSKKVSMPKKLKGKIFEIFQNFRRKTSRKLKGDPLVKKHFPKKVPQCRKKLEGGPLVSPSIVWKNGKKRKNGSI